MGVAISEGYVQFSGRDAASCIYNTGKGLGRLKGFAYWLFRWKVTVPESDLVQQIWDLRDARFIKSYLDSRRVTLVGENHFNTLPKQQYHNSCAARCLQQAAYELGINQIPNNRLYQFNGQSILDRSAEAAIYAITGRLVSGNGELQPDLLGDLNNGPASGPVGIRNATRLLGLDSRLYCSSWLTEWYFGQRDPVCWREIKKYCPVHRTSPPRLCRNERLLVHVCNYSMLGLDDHGLKVRRDHYIMQRPDGSCYNPDTGINYPSVKAYARRTGIRPSGVYMLVSDKDSYATLPTLKSRAGNVGTGRGTFAAGG
ncbi:hypothetical protein [Endozoicomonas sp. ALE010]|uniref:hypothetical protein n=1 Tax=Endozoicomonas sp. ALE010 TaxID=3403081 RepID=UPI003BB7CB66